MSMSNPLQTGMRVAGRPAPRARGRRGHARPGDRRGHVILLLLPCAAMLFQRAMLRAPLLRAVLMYRRAVRGACSRASAA